MSYKEDDKNRELALFERKKYYRELDPQLDFFVTDFSDVVLKDDMQSMEFPFYSLKSVARVQTVRHEVGDSFVEIQSGSKGLATIHDKDLLIYCISHAIKKINDSENIAPESVSFHPADYFKAVGKSTGGKQYKLFEDSLIRLQETHIRTELKHDNGDTTVIREPLIGRYEYERDSNDTLLYCRVYFSPWVKFAIQQRNVLTINKEYFTLKKAIDKRLYEIAKKHIGSKPYFPIGVKKLKEKVGSTATLKKFKYQISLLTRTNHLPEFDVSFSDDGNNVIFKRRKRLINKSHDTYDNPPLTDNMIAGCISVAPKYDPVYLYNEWINFWVMKGRERLIDYEKAYISYCKFTNSMNPNP